MTLAPVSSSDAISSIAVGEWPAFTVAQILADTGGNPGAAVAGVNV
jgi:hypothetical protein